MGIPIFVQARSLEMSTVNGQRPLPSGRCDLVSVLFILSLLLGPCCFIDIFSQQLSHMI